MNSLLFDCSKSLKTTSKEEKNSSPGKTPIHNQEMELELDVLV